MSSPDDGPIGTETGNTPAPEHAGFDMAYIAARLPWVDDPDYLPAF